MSDPKHVVVIGAGIVGAASALELLRDGQRVTILEPGPPGGEQAASFGNGAWFSTASVIPVSTPGIWKRVPGWLRDPLGPLTIRWRYLPRLLPWLIRFLHAGATEARVAATARALRPLIADAPARHLALAREAGVPDLVERKGILYAFPSREAFEAEAMAWRIRHATGIRWIELDADELRQREPALDRRYTFAVLVEDGGSCTDPGSYVAALIRHAEARGATRVQARATGFRITGGRLHAVLTDSGEIAADAAVIAAGAWSKVLARAAGDSVSLETERGYHAAIPAPAAAPRHPLSHNDAKMVTGIVGGALRAAGTVELAGLDAPPNWKRAEALRDIARAAYPDLGPETERAQFWMGHRPSTPDGLPCIGPARACRDIIHAYGHGHIGLSAGAMTGRLVADLLAGRAPTIDIAPFSPQRFRAFA